MNKLSPFIIALTFAAIPLVGQIDGPAAAPPEVPGTRVVAAPHGLDDLDVVSVPRVVWPEESVAARATAEP